MKKGRCRVKLPSPRDVTPKITNVKTAGLEEFRIKTKEATGQEKQPAKVSTKSTQNLAQGGKRKKG